MVVRELSGCQWCPANPADNGTKNAPPRVPSQLDRVAPLRNVAPPGQCLLADGNLVFDAADVSQRIG